MSANPAASPLEGGLSPRIAPLPTEEWSQEVVTALQVGSDLMAEEMKVALEKGDLQALEALLPIAVTTPLRHPRLAGRFMAYSGITAWRRSTATLARAADPSHALAYRVSLRMAVARPYGTTTQDQLS